MNEARDGAFTERNRQGTSSLFEENVTVPLGGKAIPLQAWTGPGGRGSQISR